MTKSVAEQEKMIRDTALRELEELSLLLDSDPEVIESMSFDEVCSDLYELGLDPNTPLPADFGHINQELVHTKPKKGKAATTTEYFGPLIDKYPVKDIGTNIRGNKAKPVHPVTRLLWWCSGASIDILRDTPTEKNRYQGIGGTVLSTSALACISGAYAISTIFDELKPLAVVTAILFGLLWGLMIFNLDRYIVSSIKKVKDSNTIRVFFRELLPALPRLVLAVFIGVVIAHPIELALFEKEISNQIEFNKDQLVNERNKELTAIYYVQIIDEQNAVDRANAELKDLRYRVDELRDKYVQEMEGAGRTQKYGQGIVAKVKEEQYRHALNEYRNSENAYTLEREKLEHEIREFEEGKINVLKEYRASLGDGLLARSKALSDLANKDRTVFFANLFIVILIILIDITPLMVKLFSSYGPYDAKLDLRDEAEMRTAEYEKDVKVEVTKHQYDFIVCVEKEISEVHFNKVRLQTRKLQQALDEVEPAIKASST